MSVKDRLLAVVATEFDWHPSDVKMDSKLADHGFDSLDALELIVALEEEFEKECAGANLPDDLITAKDSFQTLLDKVSAEISRRAKPVASEPVDSVRCEPERT